eukprot:scaffold31215_cov49-Phaeocystis_antarctica.AAC.1
MISPSGAHFLLGRQPVLGEEALPCLAGVGCVTRRPRVVGLECVLREDGRHGQPTSHSPAAIRASVHHHPQRRIQHANDVHVRRGAADHLWDVVQVDHRAPCAGRAATKQE